MHYQVGEAGRIVVIRLEDGDEILKNLVDVCKRENIRAGVIYLVGGIRDGTIVVGPEKDELPPVPVWRSLNESYETLGIATVFWHKDEPRIHFHGAYGKWDTVKAGCLRESGRTFIVMEAIIMEIKNINATRELDPASHMILLKLHD